MNDPTVAFVADASAHAAAVANALEALGFAAGDAAAADLLVLPASAIAATPAGDGDAFANPSGPLRLAYAEAVDDAVRAAYAAGIDVITLSLGALADEGLARDLAAAAEAGGARLHLASGAIGALDALRAGAAGGLRSVCYTGRKPPKGWAGSPAEDVLDLSSLTTPAAHFEGSARQAALRYPKNANVAAAVALAGLGFDQTQARLVADPTAAGNIHEVEAEGNFGSFRFEITGASLPDNPRSSALAAMSVLAEVRRLRARVTT